MIRKNGPRQKHIIPLSFLLLFFGIYVSCSVNDTVVIKNTRDKVIKKMEESVTLYDSSEKSPRSINKDGKVVMVSSSDWTSGFYPGCLWYVYEMTGDTLFKKAAEKHTEILEQEKDNNTTHDMGFKMLCSFGNGYRLTRNRHYRDVLIESAHTLATRYSPVTGCIRSWDHHASRWQFPVIIDNMMNLELLFWAFKETGDSLFYNIAVSHANRTLKNHFRPDYSSWHVVDYDTITGKVIGKVTHQGYADSSAWARGQAWGLYGFTMAYRYTGDKRYLDQANHIAEFILRHLPRDRVPYWDFDAPDIPHEPRDASAAAITASALYELSTYEKDKTAYFFHNAEKILTSLATKYMTPPDAHNGFLLDHSTGNYPAHSEVDVPIIYADYYFLEALIRRGDIKNKK